MAVVKKKRVRWTLPNDSDLVATRVRVNGTDGTIFLSDPFIDVPFPEAEIILPDAFPPGTFDLDTNYIVGLSSIDDVGNEGDIIEVSSPFDFVAPGVPTQIVVENI